MAMEDGKKCRTAKLSPAHERMLFEGSGISARVAVKRGYRTVTSKAALERLGFGRSQRNVPALLIPIYGPTGEVVLYQSRPDEPRIGRRGRPVKYETPSGASMTLDVHPLCRERLGDPGVPLFVTEGIKKADALVSKGLCVVALIGVWNWRGTNERGGKTALSEWEYVALEGRKVYVVFDSDVMEKREVYAALSRLKGFLGGRGARVSLIYLPAADSGAKQGVDDFLASGHTVQDLLGYATPELKQPPDSEGDPSLPYRATPAGLIWDKPTQNGPVPTPLTNFTAKITSDISEDDGVETKRRFEIEASLNGRHAVFSVPSKTFASMSWATEHLGAGAIVYPGFSLKDHARAAVQVLSGEIPTQHVYTHTGWRWINGEWVYLHAGGAIGADRLIEQVKTSLAGTLHRRLLPEPPEGEELVAAIRASLRFCRLAPAGITVALLAVIYRAALGDTDFSIHLSGPTGEGKSELAALCQQHFGGELDARHLLSWESTENAIEAQAFTLKDQVLVLDDFAPTGSSYDVQRWHKKADRVLRAKGNAAGRQRMRPDTTLREDKPPRALILSTGEDIPRGQSLRARMLLLELAPGTLDWKILTRCQRDAAGGLYARAMAAFLRWLAPRYEQIKTSLAEERAAIREHARRESGEHRRTPSLVADLYLGLRYFLLFAYDAGALTGEEAERLCRRGWQAILEAASAQQQHQSASEPTRRFRELLSAAIASGRAHVADPEGAPPENPGAWGWRSATIGTGDFMREEWRPQGERVGWLDVDHLYLEPEASYAAAQKQGRDADDPLTITGRTLRKRLHERGLLLSTDEARRVLTVRKTLEGRRREVLHTKDELLLPFTGKPDQPDHDDRNPHKYADSVPPLWSDCDFFTRPRPAQPDQKPDHEKPPTCAGKPADGQVGQVSCNSEEGEGESGVRRGARERFTI